jgi:uncharacterized protein (TIGR02145 family)
MKNTKTSKIYAFALIVLFLISTYSCKKDKKEEANSPMYGENVSDIDGNIYHTVIIGTQQWMVENLKVTRYRNGDTIPNVIDSLAWYDLTTGAYCNYGNSPGKAITYGRLYNFYTISDTRNICPAGWHVPSSEEWTTLIDFLGGENVAGGKMKELGTTHWEWTYKDFTNDYGFTALPGGRRSGGDDPYLDNEYKGRYAFFGNQAYWWSTTTMSLDDWVTGYEIGTQSYSIIAFRDPKNTGHSIRCIKD